MENSKATPEKIQLCEGLSPGGGLTSARLARRFQAAFRRRGRGQAAETGLCLSAAAELLHFHPALLQLLHFLPPRLHLP